MITSLCTFQFLGAHPLKDAAAKGKKVRSLSESYPGARTAFQVFKYQ